jgi:hypothetical protein
MRLVEKFKHASMLTKVAIFGNLACAGLVAYALTTTHNTNDTPPDPDLSVSVVELDTAPAPPPLRITVDPPIVKEPIKKPTIDIETATHLHDFRDNFSGDALWYLDLSLKLEEVTGMDAYAIFAKLTVETMLDRDFVKRMSDARDVQGARGEFQQQLGNIVAEIRKYGDQLTTVNALPEDDILRLAVEHHGRAEYLKQMPFYSTLDKDDPLKIAIDKGRYKSDFSKSEGYTELPQLEKDMVQSWNNHTRIDDPLLVQYIAQQAKNRKFGNKFDEAIYDIPNNPLIAGELALQHGKNHVPSAHASNFANGSWADNIEARNKAAFALYAPHNMGVNGGPLQLEIADNPDYANLRLSDTRQLQDAINVVNKALGLRKVSVAKLQGNANSNPAVFHEGKDTLFGCYEYNITTEIASHLGKYMPVTAYGQFNLWHDHGCGKNPIGSIRPQGRPAITYKIIESSNSVAPTSSLRPLARPDRITTLAQN